MFFTLCFSSQASELDSLLNQLSELSEKHSPDDLDQKSIICNSIAVKYQGISEPDKARFYFLQSIHFTEERISLTNGWDNAQNVYDLAYLYKNLATFESSIKNTALSRKHLKTSEKYYKELKNYLSLEEYQGIIIQFYSSAFVNAYHANDFETGELYITKVEELAKEVYSKKDQAEVYRLHGELYSAQKKYTIAIEYFDKGLKLLKTVPDSLKTPHDEQHHLHSTVSATYHSGDYRGVIERIKAVPPYSDVSMAKKYFKENDFKSVGQFINNMFIYSYALVNVFKSTNDTVYLNEAFEWQKLAYAIAEDFTLKNRAEKLGSTVSNPKNKIMALMLTASYINEIEALSSNQVLELIRAVDVYHSTRLHLERISNELNASSWKAQKDLKNQLNYVNAKLDEAMVGGESEHLLDSLRDKAYEITLELTAIEKNTKREKVLDEYRIGQQGFNQGVKSYLSKHQKNLITYFYDSGSDSLYIIGATENSDFFEAITVPDTFSNVIKQQYELNAHLQYDQVAIALQKKLNHHLYDLLFAPVREQLTCEQLLIYPIGELSYISFDALLKPNEEYLVNDYAFQYTTSLYSIISFKGETPKKVVSSAYYPKDYGTDSLAFLTNAKREVNEMKEVLGSHIYQGEEATKYTYLHSDHQNIVHFATHSVLDRKQPYDSYIIFQATDSGNQSYLLHAYEIFSQTLKADLVTLSSCNSAAGEIQEGIGIVSLSNAFYFAGVPATISSLWSAQDESSATIMTDFYKALKEGETKSQSLKIAKQRFLQQADKIRSQPFFWANYVVYGADIPLYPAQKSHSIYRKWLFIGGGLLLIIGIGRMAKKRYFNSAKSA